MEHLKEVQNQIILLGSLYEAIATKFKITATVFDEADKNNAKSNKLEKSK